MRICIIGQTGHYNYAMNVLEKERDVELAGVAPGSAGENLESLLASAAKQGLSPRVFPNWLEMLDTIKPAVAVVSCFFCDHARIAVECAKRGIHVFVDKPIATTFEALAGLRSAVAASKIQLAAMFGIRYESAFLTAHDLIEKGVIGEVRLMNAQKSYKLGSRGDHYKNRDLYGGTIPWVGAHAIDWFRWFSGAKFMSVFATHSTAANNSHKDLESTASCLFEMTGGVSATLAIDYLRPMSAPTHGDDRIRIVGTKGVVEVRSDSVYLIDSVTGEIQTPMLLPARDIFSDFLNQVRGRGKCMVTMEDSFYITEVALISRQSADEKRVIKL